jgi:hypothetical protein
MIALVQLFVQTAVRSVLVEGEVLHEEALGYLHHILPQPPKLRRDCAWWPRRISSFVSDRRRRWHWPVARRGLSENN